jgi:hypothetical protein
MPRLLPSLAFAAVVVVACSKDPPPTLNTSSATTKAFKDCSRQTSAAKCSDAEYKPYDDCTNAKCGDKYTACFGADYTNGKFSGPCADFGACEQKCNCEKTCIGKCKVSDECLACSADLATCNKQCTPPACAAKASTPKDAGSGTSTTSGDGG